MAIFVDDGLEDINLLILQQTSVISFTLRLYVNNYVIALTSVTANFVEAGAVAGYAPFMFNPTDWVTGVVAGIFTATYPAITFTFTAYSGSPYTIYGYYVTNPVTGNTIWGETAVVPYTIPLTGGSLTLYPTWVDQNLP